MITPEVTMVITSCGRFSLLRRTLDTFFAFNTYPITEVVITEDSREALPDWVDLYHPRTRLLNPRVHAGQVPSIDRAYALVTTPYIFHVEDDWEFYRPGFIEASMAIMEAEPQCITVWLRERTSTNGHPVEGDRLALDHEGWHGFAWSPTLKRLRDYRAIGSYGALVAAYPGPLPEDQPWLKERVVDAEYWRRGFYAKITPHGYVKHIGYGWRVRAV